VTHRARDTGKVAAAVFALVLATGVAAQDAIIPFDPDYAPLSFQDDAGEADGFDVDVARAIAGKLGITPEFSPELFRTIKSGGWPEDWIYSVASMSRNAEREEAFDFVGPYYYDAVILVGPPGTEGATVTAARDKRIGTCSGCIYADYIAGQYRNVDGNEIKPFGNARVVLFPTETDMLRSLADPAEDLIDFGMTSVHKVDFFIATGRPVTKVSGPIFVEPVWIAVPKGHEEMRASVEEAWRALGSDGTLGELSRRWLGEDYTRLPDAGNG
jgi:polar amino acid transport system substrate-binding protein